MTYIDEFYAGEALYLGHTNKVSFIYVTLTQPFHAWERASWSCNWVRPLHQEEKSPHWPILQSCWYQGEQEKVISCTFSGYVYGINRKTMHCSALYTVLIALYSAEYPLLVLIHHSCITLSAKMTVGKLFPSKLKRRKKSVSVTLPCLRAVCWFFKIPFNFFYHLILDLCYGG